MDEDFPDDGGDYTGNLADAYAGEDQDPYNAIGSSRDSQADYEDMDRRINSLGPPSMGSSSGGYAAGPGDGMGRMPQYIRMPADRQPAQDVPQNIIPEPFSQADSLRMQQLSQGLSAIGQQVDDGSLSPEEGMALKQQILRMQQPLQMKQQAAQAQQKMQGLNSLMEQEGLTEAIAHKNSVDQARDFHQTVASYTDPLTGATAH